MTTSSATPDNEEWLNLYNRSIYNVAFQPEYENDELSVHVQGLELDNLCPPIQMIELFD